MAKGNRKVTKATRKRANGKIKESVVAAPAKLVNPIMEHEAKYFQELVDISNYYSGLMKQQAQFAFVVKSLQEARKKIQKDEVKMPVSITLIPKIMSYQEYDKKKVFKMFDMHIKTYQQKLSALETQLNFGRENFLEAGIRNREFLARRFGDATAKNIVPDRNIIKEEETLFESEIDDLVNDPKVSKKFEEAKKEAVKRNDENKAVCECESCKDKSKK